MPYPIQTTFFGLGKETVRGVPVMPTRFIAVTADSNLDYKVTLLEDELIRGMFVKFPPQSGIKEGSGTINLDVTSTNIGEFLNSLLGSVVTEQPVSGVYLHKFRRHISSITMPSYTIHRELGMVKKRYPLSVVKSITFTGTLDGKVSASVSILFKTEETETGTYTPVWPEHTPFMFYQTSLSLAGIVNTDIREWSLTIDNGSTAIRTLAGSPDIKDILTFSNVLINGSFTIYFETEEERNKFLNNTSTSLEITLEGEVISGTHRHMLKFILPRIHYTAYPFTNIDGLLGSSVTFNCYQSLATGLPIEIQLQNIIPNY